MPEEQRFFYICTKNKYTASGAKRGHGETEMVLSLTFLPDASHGAISGCGSRSKQTLNMLFPKLREFYYLSLKITIYCTRDNHNYVPLDQELLIFKQMLPYCTKTL